MSCDCSIPVLLLNGAMGRSTVCDCDISWSYSIWGQVMLSHIKPSYSNHVLTILLVLIIL